MTKNASPLQFEELAVCTNPMEAEIFPAALREAEIPHRTEWKQAGALTILVPQDWLAEARAVLARASQVFFGAANQPTDPEPGASKPKDGPTQTAAAKPAMLEDRSDEHAAGPEEDRMEPGRDEEEKEAETGMFLDDALPTAEETRLRAVWPAWALAAVPGLGLGHLYAGKPQMFFYLVFSSLLGGLFFQYTGSWWSFLLPAFSWLVDLGFAAMHVKDHNRQALRARKRLEQAEQSFLESV
jgi:hypothetical protein